MLRSLKRLVFLNAVLLAGTSGCAHRAAVQRIEFEPLLITPGSAEDMKLATLTDEELLALGTSSFASQDFEKAARCFARLADAFPQSSHRSQAAFNAGLSYERLGRFAEALERFLPLMDAAKGQGDALDAAFRAAECCYHLDRYAQAVEILATIAARRDISAQDRLQAKVQRGICMIEQQHLPEAEQALREALDDWEAAKDTERLDAYFPAQAEFFLGEIFRLHFEGVALDPDRGEDQLGKALENKCELLLSAQGHYLRAIRMGEGQWATASGFRVGALYEALRKAMLEAKVPASLDAEQAQVYREELRRRVRVLVTKAMAVYERTLEAAERLGIESPFVTETRRSLERMKELLLEEPEKAPAETQASLKSPP